jgi:hypothetical protein
MFAVMWEREIIHTEFWFESIKGRDGRLMLEWILDKQGWKVRTGFIWLRMGTSGRLL